MNVSDIQNRLTRRFPSRLRTIDSHTGGELTRLIVDGVGPISGDTMAEKLKFFQMHYDRIRLQLTREPRGHRDMMAAVVTEPATAGADFGLIYMDARRYPYLCGHATIGAVTTLIEAGVLDCRSPETQVTVDTPSGPMAARARIANGRVESVAICTVPCFVLGTDHVLDVQEWGEIQVDMVCAGGFFAMVSADQIEPAVTSGNASQLIDLGMAVIEAANRQLVVHHPTRPEVTTTDVAEFYDPAHHGRGCGKNAVVYGEAHMDRSPCGTGTAAKMTLLHHLGMLEVNQPFLNAGPLDTVFEGRIVEKTRVGDLDAVVAEIRGSAYITGTHEFVEDPGDPLVEGFLL